MTGPLQFRIHGMDCADEVALLKRALVPVVGSAERLQFDVLRGKMTVTEGDPAVTADHIVREVGRTGLRAEPWTEQAVEGKGAARNLRTALTAACGLLAAAAFGLHADRSGVLAALGSEGAGQAEAVPLPSMVLYAVAIAAGGWHIAPRAWFALRRLRPDMNLLMSIAVVGAVAIGEWFEAATVTFLFAVSLALEAWSVGRARRAVEALLAIAPPTARLLAADGSQSEVPAVDVLPGAIILAKPGDRIALDGTVRKGSSQVNQAPITGESMPVDKEPGADVFAGTINGSGALEIEVTRVSGETTLAQIIRMVGEAQSRRAPAEQWVDRFALIYTPVIFGLAVAVAFVPPLFGGDLSEWFYRALVLLVIGCPCALVISTPVSIVASLASAARNGVLVKGGAFIEAPGKLRVVALDKTGTLTEGQPKVVEVRPLGTHTGDELLRAAVAIEAHSDHPLARAIVAYATGRGISAPAATEVQAVDGRGVTAQYDGKKYWLGSHRYLEELGQETPAVHDQLEAMSAPGRTAVIVGTDDHVCGFFGLADAIRPESVAAIKEMRAAGVAHIVMLTGDNRATADNIARETGVDDVRAELLPADKVKAIEALVLQYGTVAMIGDGVNDAPAMGRATIGIAMGAAGSDAAIEAADIALMSDDLSKLPWLIRHSRRTLGIIHQNVALSIGVKVIFLALTLFGSASLWSAIAADMGVSLIVVANALRLLR
jgi:Cd2+/Zn2+-exporting ATPase